MRHFEDRLAARVSRMESADRALADESREVRDRRAGDVRADRSGPLASGDRDTPLPQSRAPALPRELALETIVLRNGRPVLAIVDDGVRLQFPDAESEVWRARLAAAAPQLERAVRAVGRIELRGHPTFEWVGTGWLVDRNIVVTNRHVAHAFAEREGAGFVFRMGTFGRMRAEVDFLEEAGRLRSREFAVLDVLDIAPDHAPDVAFLRVEPTAGRHTLAEPIPLFDGVVEIDRQVAVIGYPARDSRIPDQDLMERIFGDLYDKKRLAPGQITAAGDVVHHDCSTLGGNSGSVVLDLETGRAVALHFAGRFLDANFAVAAPVVAERLSALSRGGTGPAVTIGEPHRPAGASAAVTPGMVAAQVSTQVTLPGPATISIPLTLTVALGTPVPQLPADTGGDDDAVFEAPLTAADYANRQGYEPAFLGHDVPLPVATTAACDVLTFDGDGRREHVLRYEHFSVVMSRSRRLCLLSAVNIDGARSRKMKRGGWRTDPRITDAEQIRHECYGNPPRFSRGHMTRREDPLWGSVEQASRANADSMHVTNAVPQLQPFNAGLWLGLENYALENARQDDMRISVFTGPVLLADDPERFGVRIPRSFWKVIAFVHDETGELTATGYTMSQEDLLRQEEFVFGQHRTFQRSLASIERLSGLSFGALVGLDPFEETEAVQQRPLLGYDQIVFRRR